MRTDTSRVSSGEHRCKFSIRAKITGNFGLNLKMICGFSHDLRTRVDVWPCLGTSRHHYGRIWFESKGCRTRRKCGLNCRILSNEYQSYSGLLTFTEPLNKHQWILDHITHLIEAGDEIELTSNDPFPNIDIDLLKDAIDSSNRSNVAVVVVENDEIILFEITSRGLREGATWTMRGGGKRGDVRMSESVAQSFQKQVAKKFSLLQMHNCP